jgi:RimJ/RimL family protein N-acetyltransferase
MPRMGSCFIVSVSLLDSALLEAVDRYWARFLGCAPEALRSNTAQIGVHTGQDDYAGRWLKERRVLCYLMEFGGAPIVSLPIGEVESYRAAIAQWQAGTVRMPALVEAVFGKRVLASRGPAFVGYSDLKHFRPAFSSSTRQLMTQDGKAVDRLRAACAVEEWEAGGSEFRPGAMVGAFRGQELAALAGYQVWGDQIAHIAVVTHPAFRGQGHATTAVSALTEMVFERSLVPQYRTLEANTSSLAVARRLGFVQYAASLAVRFASSDSEGNGGTG